MPIKNDNVLIVFGMLSLTIAILLSRYVHENSYVAFMEGLLYGLSVTFNIAYLIRFRRKKEK